MPPKPRNSKGANMPPVGENEMASRQRGKVPLIEQEVVLEQRNAKQEPYPVA